MTTRDLISNYAVYTTAEDFSSAALDTAPAITPTATSSAACINTISMTITATINVGC